MVLESNKALSSNQKSVLTDKANEKIISQFSFIELAITINIGKLPHFKVSLENFIKQVREDSFTILAVQNQHISNYVTLPFVSSHRDPFDRFLIATAIIENMTIITADEKFKAYDHLVQLMY